MPNRKTPQRRIDELAMNEWNGLPGTFFIVETCSEQVNTSRVLAAASHIVAAHAVCENNRNLPKRIYQRINGRRYAFIQQFESEKYRQDLDILRAASQVYEYFAVTDLENKPGISRLDMEAHSLSSLQKYSPSARHYQKLPNGEFKRL